MSQESDQHARPPGSELLDRLGSHIAILNQGGRIVWVNRAWKRFGLANESRDAEFGVGTSYEGLCESAAAEGVTDAGTMLDGLHAVGREAVESFTHAYDCSSPDELRTFQAQIAPAHIDNQRLIMLTHDNISTAVEHAKTVTRLASLSQLTNPSAAAGAIGSMISHELSNPVTALICALAGARRLLTAPDPDMPLTAEVIEQAIGHAERTRGMMAALRTITPTARITIAPTDLAALVGSVIETTTEDARAQSVRIKHNLSPALAETDPTHASLVLLALFRHALRCASERPVARRTLLITTMVESGLPRVRVDLPANEPGATFQHAAGREVADPFGLDYAARVATELGGTVTVDPRTCSLVLPRSRKAAA